ncbi:hypothetical protein M878_24605 [Streptomyces roseochromogenus subsp. oscitans DS 12.976]|uniref:Histidine kinase/HSP90-like ATPase domain-containing protein n=1 Tax=Streptomyces roseochromogenus subsp. oscitans DS 12.976 TaxID=1352936 RepID=V6K876_STRRC|nr:hypothetical protein M878_24605 [Streptomyces roseochromogenus subsp. oscitans DS 12.976]
MTLSSEAAAVPEIRRLARTACAAWNLSDEAANTAELLISEIATNALKHGRSCSIRVKVERPCTDRVRVSVVDRSRCLAELRQAAVEDVSGRGLLIVDALSDRWGSDLLPWGKRMWAEIVVKVEDGR